MLRSLSAASIILAAAGRLARQRPVLNSKAAREALVKARPAAAGRARDAPSRRPRGDGRRSSTRRRPHERRPRRRKTRATATDPPTPAAAARHEPARPGQRRRRRHRPEHERPLAADPTARDSGEDVVVGRARGEQNANGAYHGHITILGALRQRARRRRQRAGRDEERPAAAAAGGHPRPAVHETNEQVCLSVLTANSTTTATGSTNDFAVARAAVLGLGVGAAESSGTIGEDANCQTSGGTAKTANVATSAAARSRRSRTRAAPRSPAAARLRS